MTLRLIDPGLPWHLEPGKERLIPDLMVLADSLGRRDDVRTLQSLAFLGQDGAALWLDRGKTKSARTY